jgi:acetyl esterase/lipase
LSYFFFNGKGDIMDLKFFLKSPPPLDPAWLAHEEAANLLAPKPIVKDPKERQEGYSKSCKDINSDLLAGREKHLNEGIDVHDEPIPGDAAGSFTILIRTYRPTSKPNIPVLAPKDSPEGQKTGPIVIYYHGGGLVVGDLDSGDMSCRRICKALQCTVYSVDYRLMPKYTAENALADAIQAFQQLTANKIPSRLVLVGSSSGGQLAAQVTQNNSKSQATKIHGVLLRGPVTCDATDDGVNLPPKWKNKHFSMSTPFHTSLLSNAAVNASNRTISPLPLEVDALGVMPRHWIQVSTNDIYYSDGVCYASALKEAGIDVKLDVVEGYPHTFWLKVILQHRNDKTPILMEIGAILTKSGTGRERYARGPEVAYRKH